MPTQDFSTTAPNPNAEPITFRLVGTTLQGQPIEPIPFTCLPDINGVTLTDAMEKAGDGEAAVAGFITRFIQQCLPDDEALRFDRTIRRKDLLFDITTLGKIMEWLFEVYGNRPTPASSGLPVGPSPTVPTSTGASGWPAGPTSGSWAPPASATSSTPS